MVLKQTGSLALLCVVASMLSAASTSKADIYGFQGLTDNSIADTNIGEAQLFVDVTSYGANQVLFRFFNIGPAASSITRAYFDDGSLLGIAQLIDSDDGSGGDAGVDFTQGASPPNIPGGNTASPPFEVTAGFLADADPPGGGAFGNGVNPNESLGIVFDLQGSQTFSDVIAELNSGQLRIGIHVQSFDGGGSESFLSIVPAPTSALLGMIGFATLGLFRGRSRP